MDELDFIILQINGVDVSHLPQHEAVKMFLSAANEPITVEVQRRFRHDCDEDDTNDVGCGIVGGGRPVGNDDNLKNINEINCDVMMVNEAQIKLDKLKISNADRMQSNNTDAAATTSTTTTKNTAQITKNPLYFTLSTVASAALLNSANKKSISKVVTTSASNTTTKATQTDHIFYALDERAAKEATDRLIEQEHVLFEQCLAPEIDIEEITLQIYDNNESFGITVCCSNNNNNNNTGSGGSGSGSGADNDAGGNCALSGSDVNVICPEIYISDIQAESIAGRDGRLHQGDQLLQINGRDIKTKEEAEAIIQEAEANQNAITLLVSRYVYTDEDDFNDPSVAEIDVEEDYDDEDEEEYYDDNNLAYENCFITTNDYINADDELDKVFVTQTHTEQHSQKQPQISTLKERIEGLSLTTATILDTAAAAVATATTAPSSATTTMTTTTTNSYRTPSDTAASNEGKSINSNDRNSYRDGNEQSVKMHFKQTAANRNIKHSIAQPHATPMNTTIDYDTEHIYETIPEDSESEPFYCSPYDSSMYLTTPVNGGAANANSNNVIGNASQEFQQHKRVAQWLGIKQSHTIASAVPRQSIRSSSGCGKSFDANSSTCFLSSSMRNRLGTTRSAVTTITNDSSSSGGGGGLGVGGCGSNGGGIGACGTGALINGSDEHDNSSSAYNTGGSNNSVAPPHGGVLNQNGGDNMIFSVDGDPSSNIILSPYNDGSMQQAQRLQSPKRKININPKNNVNIITMPLGNMEDMLVNGCGRMRTLNDVQTQLVDMSRITSNYAADLRLMEAQQQQQQQYSPKLFPTNSKRHIMLQQKLFKQASANQQQQQQQQLQQQQKQRRNYLPTMNMNYPQFTAPNLSQYHFVSGQEVSATNRMSATIADATAAAGGGDATAVVVRTTTTTQQTTPNDEIPMVWKVKRRPDGTRYIVRRPARNCTRLVRNSRTLRLNTEHLRNDFTTTTEEDTISEVKTGRYWSKEERKKHIERARERRLQHQIQHQQQQLELLGAENQLVPTMRISDRFSKLQQRDQQRQHRQHILSQQQQPNNTQLSAAAVMNNKINGIATTTASNEVLPATKAPMLFVPSSSKIVTTANAQLCNNVMDAMLINSTAPPVAALSTVLPINSPMLHDCMASSSSTTAQTISHNSPQPNILPSSASDNNKINMLSV